ncbi:MAG: hypothetical protein ACQXXJ_08305 [Candidatus Bathyarchaeia archaeon]
MTIFILFLLFMAPPATAENFTISYQLINQSTGVGTHILNVAVPHALLDYYSSLTHKSASIIDFPKFVTPYALKPIADCLREVYPEDEDFTNAVLSIVHQIPYEETVEAYYPLETIIRNRGDCDLTSVMAASILKAGGLDVVLLFYESEEHMNVGVCLNQPPRDARLPVFFLQNNGAKYYVAETTSAAWENSWRVGECPEDLKGATVQIVTLQDSEQIAPGQVSASFTALASTSIEFEVSPTLTFEGTEVTVKGKITPAIPNENVTIYWSQNGEAWQILTIAPTDVNGQFVYTWKPKSAGILDTCKIQASWVGNHQYAGTTSQPKMVIILSLIIVMCSAATVAVVAAGLVCWKRKSKVLPPASPVCPNDLTDPPAAPS